MGLSSSKGKKSERFSTNGGAARKNGSGASTTSAGSSQPGQNLSLLKKASAKTVMEARISSLRRQTRIPGVLYQGRDDSLSEDVENNLEMTTAEAAFLTRDVRERLSQFVNGMLPPAPALFPKPGAALFVDISGFTALGDRLRQTSTDSKQAAERLARQITYVLNELTRTCLACGGDVAKFAGDALLCTFTGGDEDECLVRAQNCAVDMLMGMRRYNNAAVNGTLQIHGGIAKGSVLHFHLGSSDDDLRWYLVAGDSVASAVALVEHANPGQILLYTKAGLLNVKAVANPKFRVEGRGFGSLAPTKKMKKDSLKPLLEEGTPIGIMGLIEENVPESAAASSSIPESPKRISKRIGASFKSRGISESEQSDISQISFGSKSEVITEDGEKIEIFTLTADTPKVELSMMSGINEVKTFAQIKAIYDVPLHTSGTSYIPKALRAGLRTGFNASEMRNRVSVVFVGMQDLALTDEELSTHVVSGDKLDRLNSAFVGMTRVAHSFDGEVRDLLFDDKGCIYIAVFGAHSASELSELKATKYAMAITQEFPKAKVGVSVGTCFVGMCGSAKRHDFVVMGHEVNIAARCMIVAQEGEVLVSPEIEKETKDLISYEKVPLKLSKKDTEGEEGFAYRANSEIARRPSFLALYRYGLRDRDLFVGRSVELSLVEQTVNTICFGHDSLIQPEVIALPVDGKKRAQEDVGDTGVIVLEAQPGMGKSAFVSRVKKLGKGRIKIASTAAFQLEQENEFFVFRHLIESYTGFRRDMTKEQLLRAADEYGGPEGEGIKLDIIAEVLPWIKDVLNPNGKNSGAGQGVSSMKAVTQRAMAGSFTEFDETQTARIGKELLKVFMGFRGELTLNQILAGEPNNGALLVIEDVQWMDLQSLKLLKYILEHLTMLQSVVFFLTTRTERRLIRAQSMNDFQELAKGIELQRTSLTEDVMELAKHGPKSQLVIPLHGLPKTDCDKLVARLLDAKDDIGCVAPSVLSFVYDKTDGFPMYVILLIEWIKDHKLITMNTKEMLDWINPTVPDTASFPNTLADTMIARFDRLEVQARNLLKIASTMGNEFDAITLTTLANIDLGKNNALTEEQVLQSLKHAADLGVLSVTRNKGIKESAHKWRFKHDTMLQAVQSLMPSERANQLKAMLKPMRQEVEKKKLVPLFAGFLGEVDDDE